MAVAHIAGTMVDSQLVLTEVLDKFERQRAHEIWTSEPTLSTHMYGERLSMAWNIALRELTEESEDSLQLLRVLAMLAPDTIPESMLIGHGPEHLAIADRSEW